MTAELELENVAKAISELRAVREQYGRDDRARLVRLSTLLRHFELILLGAIENRLHIQ